MRSIHFSMYDWSIPEPPSPVVEDPDPDPPADDAESLRQDLEALERARREIMAQIATPDGLVLHAEETPPEPTPTSGDALENIEAKVTLLSEQLALLGEDQAFAEIKKPGSARTNEPRELDCPCRNRLAAR